MIIYPCYWCSYAGECAKEQINRNAIMEINQTVKISRVHFQCKLYYQQYQPGEWVFVTEWLYEAEGGWNNDTIEGIIMGWKGRKVKIFIPDNEREKNIILLYPRKPFSNDSERIEKNDKPFIEMCPECGIPKGYQNKKDWDCGLCKGRYTEEQYLKNPNPYIELEQYDDPF